MILFEIYQTEHNATYQELEISNGVRQYDLLRSLVLASVATQRPFLSSTIIKALNYHAITCLHTNAGEYRPCEVTVGEYNPPAQHSVQALMDDFINFVNRTWETADPVVLAAYVLWRLNYVHPFINGNGRTARAAAYFVICVALGGWLPGEIILPELIKRNRDDYVVALRKVDDSYRAGSLDLSPLHELLVALLQQQLSSAASVDGDEPPA